MKIAVALQSFGLVAVTVGCWVLFGVGVAILVVGVLAAATGAVLERES